ncbi:MAG: hypothetical protein OXR07_08090 [Nitrospira sp.]|nr:hypothetical protein [Nitrospira sp.]
MTTAYPTIRAASVIGAGAWGTALARHLANQVPAFAGMTEGEQE